MLLKQIPNFPGYSITTNGQVWSGPKRGKGGHSGKWLKPSDNGHGYLQFCLCKKGKMFAFKAHRLVLETFVGPCPKDKQCRHLDGDKRNNSLSNLKWGTASENQQDALRHGTHRHGNPVGEQQGNSKLTETKVKLIRYLHSTKLFRNIDLAWQFDVSGSLICNIVKRKRWKHI